LRAEIMRRVVFVAIVGCFVGAERGWAGDVQESDDAITVLHELRYREGLSKACTLDLAMPKLAGGSPRPAIVVIHGGGWLEGDKSSFVSPTARVPGNILDFAKHGFVAVAINYRMSREAPYPAALDDCRCAVRWLRAHADEYKIDTNHIGAYGNSAGGHLALLLGMLPDSVDLARQEPYANQSSRVQAVVSDSGPLDLLEQHQQNWLQGVIELFMGGPPDATRVDQYRQASPVNHITDQLPAMLLIYGEADSQVNVAITDRFVAALSKAGHKNVSYLRLANVDHCPHSLIRIPYLQPAVFDFFGRTLLKTGQKKP